MFLETVDLLSKLGEVYPGFIQVKRKPHDTFVEIDLWQLDGSQEKLFLTASKGMVDLYGSDKSKKVLSPSSYIEERLRSYAGRHD